MLEGLTVEIGVQKKAVYLKPSTEGKTMLPYNHSVSKYSLQCFLDRFAEE